MPRLTANYLTVDPATGKVGADFSGHIHASGLDLDKDLTGAVPVENQIRFLYPDGSVGARLMDFLNNTPGPDNDFLIEAPDDANGHYARLELLTRRSGGSAYEEGLTASASGAGGVHEATIIADTGASDFLQLAISGGSQQLAIEVQDTGVMSLNGGAAVGANGTWNEIFGHNLGRTPQWAGIIATFGGTGFVGFADLIFAKTNANITVRFRLVNGAALAIASTARFLLATIG